MLLLVLAMLIAFAQAGSLVEALKAKSQTADHLQGSDQEYFQQSNLVEISCHRVIPLPAQIATLAQEAGNIFNSADQLSQDQKNRLAQIKSEAQVILQKLSETAAMARQTRQTAMQMAEFNRLPEHWTLHWNHIMIPCEDGERQALQYMNSIETYTTPKPEPPVVTEPPVVPEPTVVPPQPTSDNPYTKYKSCANLERQRSIYRGLEAEFTHRCPRVMKALFEQSPLVDAALQFLQCGASTPIADSSYAAWDTCADLSEQYAIYTGIMEKYAKGCPRHFGFAFTPKLGLIAAARTQLKC
jgi:hypothetical protein